MRHVFPEFHHYISIHVPTYQSPVFDMTVPHNTPDSARKQLHPMIFDEIPQYYFPFDTKL